MPVELDVAAMEGGTLIITAGFKDENKQSVVPNELFWTLSDMAGTVINGRDRVSMAPAETVDLVLRGDDLALPEGRDAWRILTLEWTYDSDAGSNLPMNDSAFFKVKNLTAL